MRSIEQVVQAAISQNLLPAGANVVKQESRPWPVVLLTALGAWFAAGPIIAFVFALFAEMMKSGPGIYILGTLILILALVILRARNLQLFMEQLAVPALLVGGGTLAMGLFRDLTAPSAAFILALLACTVAWTVPRTWLRNLLGALACGLFVFACTPEHAYDNASGFTYRLWLGWHLALALWLANHWLMASDYYLGKTAHSVTALDAFSSGWILVTLAGLAVWSGMTFLLGGAMGVAGGAHTTVPIAQAWIGTALRAFSVALVLGSAAWFAQRWPSLRQWWCGLAALIVAGLAWQLPALGAVMCVLSYCLGTGRLKMAGAATVAAAWIIGSYYYQLDTPLAVKALRLLGAGVVLGLLAWAGAGKGLISIEKNTAAPSRGGIGIGIAAVLVLFVANGAIWQKENLIAHGSPVYVELAPADPRSLMQGDFMRLNYRLPVDDKDRSSSMIGDKRLHIVARNDAHGVATLLRVHQGQALATDEYLLELTPHHNGWILVSDAWFFREGEANRWAGAKYGEFRVLPDGRALLVDLRGPKLEKL
jgi:uncharacterized membrane-anchored protein